MIEQKALMPKLAFLALILCTAAVLYSSDATSRNEKNLIVGSWDCNASGIRNGTKVDLIGQSNFDIDGSLSINAIMTILLPNDLGRIKLAVSMTGQWWIEDGMLVETTESFNLKDLSPNEYSKQVMDGYKNAPHPDSYQKIMRV